VEAGDSAWDLQLRPEGLIHQSVRLPAWIAGLTAATGALVAVGMISMGYYASQGGLLIAGTIAFMAGTGAAAMVDPARRGLNTAIVAFYIAVLAAAYFLILPALVGPVPPGARGGPGVYPPTAGGSPGVYPPR
jgi:hypothetical protein